MSLKVYDCRFKGSSQSIISVHVLLRRISVSDGFTFCRARSRTAVELWAKATILQTSTRAPTSRSSANSFIIDCLSLVENISAGWTMLEKFGSLRNFVQNLKTSRVHLLIQSRPSVQFTGSAALLDRFHFPALRLSDSWSYCRDSCFSFRYIVKKKKTASFLMQEHFLILVLLWLCFKPGSSN